MGIIIFRKERNDKSRKKRFAIFEEGGDYQGINAVIRAILKKVVLKYGIQVI